MKMITLVVCCLFFGIELGKAQVEKACPDPSPLGYAWKKGGIEKVHFAVRDELKVSLDERAYHFPDLQLQVSAFVNAKGHVICEYRNVVSEPLFAISMGKPKT